MLYLFFFFFLVFFFQAEDGIRYLVRSRGLGDVYKRQAYVESDHQSGEKEPINQHNALAQHVGRFFRCLREGRRCDEKAFVCLEPVSYTHLTLPTSDLV